MGVERIALGEVCQIVEEVEASGVVSLPELFQEPPAEPLREHAHRQEEVWSTGYPTLAVQRDAAGGNDEVQVRVVGERRAPGVEHPGEANAGAEMLGVGGDGDQGLGGDLEQDAVDLGLIVVGDVGDLGRHGEHHVAIWHRQELGLTRGEPIDGRRLAFGTMPVAARVVGDVLVGAVGAAYDVATERRGAAALDRRHDLELAEADMTGVGATPRRAVGAEDIRDLERRGAMAAAVYLGGLAFLVRRSSGLWTALSVVPATWL